MESKGWYCRHRLPHFDDPTAVQMVTFCLADAWAGVSRTDAPSDTELDRARGDCLLADVRIGHLVAEAIRARDAEQYDLYAWVVMPNHVHLLFGQRPTWPLARVMHSLKGSTGFAANRILGRRCRFWQPEYWDRYIRNAEHFRLAVEYIENNPVKAGLVDHPWEWKWGSAFDRAEGAEAATSAALPERGA